MARRLTPDLYDRLFEGDRRAAARLITVLENDESQAGPIVRAIHHKTGRAHIIGITGAPGAGKSTLVDALSDELRNRGKTVGVIAIDPSSPFTGGAFLGDRIRMQRRSTDKDVFIRSMGSRGNLGGLSRATADAIKVMDAMGKDYILIETVGVGQAEIDIVKHADTTVVVLVPGMGDEIQSIKAGIMEIGDVFVVNKADRGGADKVVGEVEMMLMMGLGSEDPRKKARREAAEDAHHAGHDKAKEFLDEDTVHAGEHEGAARKQADAATMHEAPPEDETPEDASRRFFEELLEAGVWYPPVQKVIAANAKHVDTLVDLFDKHLGWLEASGERTRRKTERAEQELLKVMQAKVLRELDEKEHLRNRFSQLRDAIATGDEDPYTGADELIAHYKGQG